MTKEDNERMSDRLFDAMGPEAFRKLGAYGHVEVTETGVDMPVTGSQTCNRLQVTSADGGETYNLRFYRRRFLRAMGETGTRDVTVSEHTGIAVLDLNRVVSKQTGVPVYRWN